MRGAGRKARPYRDRSARSEPQSVSLRSPFSNPSLFVATAAAFAVHVGALSFAPTQLMLRVVPLTEWTAWGRILLVAFTLVVAMELHKWLRRPRPVSPSRRLREARASSWVLSPMKKRRRRALARPDPAGGGRRPFSTLPFGP